MVRSSANNSVAVTSPFSNGNMLFLPDTPCCTCQFSCRVSQLLAPTDEAFDKLLVTLGGANGPLPLESLLKLSTLKDILL